MSFRLTNPKLDQREAPFRDGLRVGINKTGRAYLMHNKVVKAKMPWGWMQLGLEIGSADLIGCTREGRFLAVETKAKWGRLRPAQEEWLAKMERLGALVVVAKSFEDVWKVLA